MAIRSDLTINWESSPRVIIVDVPSVECTMQDLLDTLRWEEAKTQNMDQPSIVSASGKEPLGGGTRVGLTVALLNAVIGFEARPGPLWTTCNLLGGNLVAFDTDGITTIEATYPTAYVSISKTSSSSATLQEQDALNYSSYGGQVSIDLNATHKYASGTAYPSGNMQYPVNNWSDAIAIASSKGFNTFGVHSDSTLTTGHSIPKKIVKGDSHIYTDLTIEAGADIEEATIVDCVVQGVMDSNVSLVNCIVKDITYMNGHIHNSGLNGNVALAGGYDALLANCHQVDPEVSPIVDGGGEGQSLSMPNYTGIVIIKNFVGDDWVGIGLSAGMVVIDESVTGGNFIVSGVGMLINNGTPNSLERTGLVCLDSIEDSIWGSKIDGIHTARELLNIYASALAGKTSGAETSELRFRDLADTKDRIVGTVDESGNRTAVTVDGS